MSSAMLICIFVCVLFAAITAKSMAKDGELEVKLQFLEYELEDLCILKNEAEWKFLNGTVPDLKKLLEIELKESETYKNEQELLQKHIEKKFQNERLQRLVDIFSHPGAPMLGNAEFTEYRDYSIKLQEILGTMRIEYSKETDSTIPDEVFNSNKSNIGSINFNGINAFLFTETKAEALKNLWVKWFNELENKNKKTKYDFVQQLSILDLEAEQNGEEELSDYWLKMADSTWVDYDKAKSLWDEVVPLYRKLKHFMMSVVAKDFGRNIFHNHSLIPVYILGSVDSYDWVTAAEKLGAFDHINAYQSLKLSLSSKSIKDLYKAADNLTSQLRLGPLPQSFYEKSRFNESSQTCRHKVTNYCEREYTPRVMYCAREDITIEDYFKINENVIKAKYLILCGKEEQENGYLFREGPRDSALYEAIESLSSSRALWSESLESLNILSNQNPQKQKIMELLITALHVIPRLPYYLATDLWRINALQEVDATVSESTAVETTTLAFPMSHSQRKRQAPNDLAGNDSDKESDDDGQTYLNTTTEASDVSKSYDTTNLTVDWWNYRAKFQEVSSPDGKVYEDYLQDPYIIWNKSYLSKFLGEILQFQILQHLKVNNFSLDEVNLVSLMQKGKSKPWQILVEELFNITEISTQPLLNYFKPLEEFLDKGIKFENDVQVFKNDDFNFVSQGYSSNPSNSNGQKPAEGSDAMFFSLAVIAAVGVVAVIVTIGRRRYKKRQRARERKRRLADL